MRWDVFISHKRTDCADFCRLLYESLSDAGYRVFLDQEDNTDLVDLLSNVRESHHLLFVLSAHVFESPWCQAELKTALQAGAHIVPIIHHGALWKDVVTGDVHEFPPIGMIPEELRPAFTSVAIPYRREFHAAAMDKLFERLGQGNASNGNNPGAAAPGVSKRQQMVLSVVDQRDRQRRTELWRIVRTCSGMALPLMVDLTIFLLLFLPLIASTSYPMVTLSPFSLQEHLWAPVAKFGEFRGLQDIGSDFRISLDSQCTGQDSSFVYNPTSVHCNATTILVPNCDRIVTAFTCHWTAALIVPVVMAVDIARTIFRLLHASSFACCRYQSWLPLLLLLPVTALTAVVFRLFSMGFDLNFLNTGCDDSPNVERTKIHTVYGKGIKLVFVALVALIPIRFLMEGILHCTGFWASTSPTANSVMPNDSTTTSPEVQIHGWSPNDSAITVDQ